MHRASRIAGRTRKAPPGRAKLLSSSTLLILDGANLSTAACAASWLGQFYQLPIETCAPSTTTIKWPIKGICLISTVDLGVSTAAGSGAGVGTCGVIVDFPLY
jgi:hypothetical protein